MSRPQFDLLTIGESLRDVFYFLDEASVSCSLQKERCLLCLEYAEKIPVRHVVKIHAAGNSANAAVSAARLGLKTKLMTWIGDDPEGEDLRDHLRQEKIDHRGILVDKRVPTNEATILSFKGEKTQLVHFNKRNYQFPALPTTRALYYSAMGSGFGSFDRKLANHLKTHRDIFFAFQPGTTHVRAGLSAMKHLLARADLFILNKEEAEQLLGDGNRTLLNMLEAFHHHGAKRVIITDGAKGADAFDGTTHWHMPIFPGKVLERTGAGDSFAAAVTVALIQNHDLATALRWGAANSWSVVQHVGPQKGLLTIAQMRIILKKFSKIKPIILSF